MTLRPEDLYHTGIVVPDLDAAMAAADRAGRLPVDQPAELHAAVPYRDGNPRTDLHHRLLRAEPAHRTRQRGPRHPWTAAPGNAVHHLGYFTDSLVESARMLESNGFALEMTGDAPGEELSLFAYYIDSFGTRIEIVDRALFPDWPAFLRAAAQPSGA